MKLNIITVIVLFCILSGCKKNGSADQSNNTDSVTVNDNQDVPTSNSSSMSTDSIHTESQNAAIQKAPAQQSSQNIQGDSTATGKIDQD